MTYYEGPAYTVTHTSTQWYRCDADGCDRTAQANQLDYWKIVNYWDGPPSHYCNEHREVQGE